MKLRIYNRTGSDGTFLNQAIASDTYYDVADTSSSSWATDSTIRSLVESGQLSVGDSVKEYNVPSEGLIYLEKFLLSGPVDGDGSSLVRTKITKTGWHFEPRSLDYYTSKVKSLYNKKFDTFTIAGGTDIGDASLRFFDSTGTELIQGEAELDALFQIRLTANCVVTYLDWEPQYLFDIKGLYFQIKDSPSTSAYLWVIAAPDIPVNLGGQICFGNGGWNLSFFADKQIFDVDGNGVKNIAYDPVYHSGKIRVLVKHGLGEQIGLQIIYKQYKV